MPYTSIFVRHRRATLLCTFLALQAGSASAETIVMLGPSVVDRTQTSTFSVAIRLFDNETRLIGYTLNVDIRGRAGSVGRVEGDASKSSFFEIENLIEAAPGGGMLDPVWSLITDPGDDGIFVNAVNVGFVSVDEAGPGHDALAEVLFEVPSDALGPFTVYLGPGSLLYAGPGRHPLDATLQGVPFDVEPLHVEIIPEPTAWGLIGAMIASLWRGTNRSGRRGGRPSRAEAIGSI